MKKLFLFGFIIFMMSACTTWQTKYEMKLTEVEVSGLIVKDLQKQDKNYNFEDENIKMDLAVKNELIEFSLLNKTNNTIKILWDNAVFIGIDNKSSRVIHQGIRYMDKANPQTPTVIVKQTTINDIVVPSDNIYFFMNTWAIDPLIPEKLTKEEVVNSKIKFYVPIEINNKINEYLLTFTITDLKKQENQWKRPNKK